MAVDLNNFDWGEASAAAVIESILTPYGLQGIAQRMYDKGKETEDPNLVYLWLREQPEYREAFPGMERRRQNKYAPIDEQTYLEWKTTYKSVMANNGIPSGFYDGEDDFAEFIGKNVSPAEVEMRVKEGYLAAQTAPQAVKDALFNYYGIDDSTLAAYWLDPSRRGSDLLRQKAATYIAGAASQADFAGLTRAEAEELVDHGRTPDQVMEAFGDLAYGKELLNALPGEVMESMSRAEQLEYAKGTPDAQRELQRRAAKRKSEFAGGGGYAESQSGVTGLAVQR